MPIHLSCTMLNTLPGFCPLLPQLSSDKLLHKCHIPRKMFFSTQFYTRSSYSMSIISYPLPSWSSFQFSILLIRWKAPWRQWNWLLLLPIPNKVLPHCKKLLGREKSWKLIFIFPESLKVTEKFPFIIHRKASENPFISVFFCFTYYLTSSIAATKISLSHNFLKLRLKPNLCCIFPHSPLSLGF